VTAVTAAISLRASTRTCFSVAAMADVSWDRTDVTATATVKTDPTKKTALNANVQGVISNVNLTVLVSENGSSAMGEVNVATGQTNATAVRGNVVETTTNVRRMDAVLKD
jgi:hypothetical protein